MKCFEKRCEKKTLFVPPEAFVVNAKHRKNITQYFHEKKNYAEEEKKKTRKRKNARIRA